MLSVSQFDPSRTSALEKMEAGPIRASSTNIERCAKQIDSKDIFILSGRLKSLSSKTTAVNQAQE